MVGYPGVEINPERRPKLEGNGMEIDADGMFVLPGFVDMHGHIGGSSQGTPAEYVFKLWLAHGITTIRDPSAGNGLDWVLRHKTRSINNEIVAPRILAYTSFGQNLSDIKVVRNLPVKERGKRGFERTYHQCRRSRIMGTGKLPERGRRN